MSLLFCLLASLLSLAQPSVSPVTHADAPPSDDLHYTGACWHKPVPPDSLYLQLDATTFLRDAEFFLPETKGYTAAGFRLSPALVYGLNRHAQLRGGVRLTSVAGFDGLWKCEPIVAIDYTPWRWMLLTLGTLDGEWGHGLKAPMYDPERWFYDYTEQGMQLRTKTRIWSSDTWLNWEHFLVPWTPDQERFTLGSRHDITLFYTKLGFSGGEPNEYIVAPLCITVPLAFVGSHRGGQFSTLDTCIETLFNESVGLKANISWENNHVIMESEWYFFQNQSPSGERFTAFENGNAFYPQVAWHHKFEQASSHSTLLCLSAGYFHGHQFISPRGSYLFQSVSWFDPNFVQAERHLVTSDITLSHREEGGFIAALDASFYYDLDLGQLDFVVGLQLGLLQRHHLRIPHR